MDVNFQIETEDGENWTIQRDGSDIDSQEDVMEEAGRSWKLGKMLVSLHLMRLTLSRLLLKVAMINKKRVVKEVENVERRMGRPSINGDSFDVCRGVFLWCACFISP